MVFKCAVSMNTVRFVAAILVVFALASAVPVPHKDKSHGSDESAELAALENSAPVNGSAEADIETDGISATNLGRIARSEDSETHVHVDGESDEEDHNDDDVEDETAEDGDNVDLVKREVDDEDEDEDDDADLDDDDDDDADSDDDNAAVVKREADSNSSEDSEDAAVEEPAASGPGAAAIVEDSPPAYKKKRDTSTSQVVLDKLASLVETVKNDPEFQQIHQAVSASEVPQPAAPASA